MARAGVLCALAVTAAVSGGAWTADLTLWWPAGVVVIEAIILVAISPEKASIRSWVTRRRSGLPACVFADAPLSKTIRALTASLVWRELRPHLTDESMLDEWREDCWQYVSYPARIEGVEALAVFAVHIPAGRGSIRGALVNEGSGQIIRQTSDRSHPPEMASVGGLA